MVSLQWENKVILKIRGTGLSLWKICDLSLHEQWDVVS